MTAPERLDGNGLAYKLNDRADLVGVLMELRDQEKRKRLGACGAQRMADDFSWESIATRRLRDYEIALSLPGRGKESLASERKSLANGRVGVDSRSGVVAELRGRKMTDL
jgi:hypothetical protein